ncbi:D-alanyl-D-alanine carboxypeptidase family protein [Ruegeria arenilitoris]|uniref:D-alanyl-D-alanine carboxypeptidase family protein n=1 Tax=Ruegeria arenilitoris TaxID=1173585 RepID=UPI00147FB150|nr:D-alanyl-D-alanine carboxypeptidase family protein [Ruegeria arenilitoris]
MLRAIRSTTLSLGLALLALPAHAFDTTARAAFVMDQKTGTVLLSKEADLPLPPASMSKLMTLYVAFEALRDGRLTLDETLPVSEHAMSYGGSTMFLNTQDRVRVEDLLRGIIVLSGNDACVVIAEALSPDGTEAGFARFMTQRAKQMGMDNSNFANSNGWPAAEHMMSVHDLAVLADRLISDFPEYYPLFAEEVYEFDGRAPSNARNRNPLLKLDIGADGLKTGHTQEAGYGLVGSAKQGDRRVIFVLSGLDSTARRAEEAEAVVNWSFRNFVERTVAKAEEPIAQAKLWMGAEKTVGLVPQEDLTLLFPVLGNENVEAEIVYDGPINTPVVQGQQLAELVIKPEGLPEIRRPLFAANSVDQGGFVVRMMAVGGIVLKEFIDTPLGQL